MKYKGNINTAEGISVKFECVEFTLDDKKSVSSVINIGGYSFKITYSVESGDVRLETDLNELTVLNCEIVPCQ